MQKQRKICNVNSSYNMSTKKENNDLYTHHGYILSYIQFLYPPPPPQDTKK